MADYILYGFVIGLIVATIVLFAIGKNLLWRWLCVASVLALAGIMLYNPGDPELGEGYTPKQQLKLGIDLQGGTSLIYDVVIPEDVENRATAIEDTIDILKRRVNPTGVLDLTWREVAGERIEVQMPLASKDVTDKRKAYEAAREALTKSNLTERTVRNLAALPVDARAAAAERLADGDAALAGDLQRLGLLHDQIEALEAVFAEVKAQLAISQGEAQRRTLEAVRDGLPEDLSQLEQAYNRLAERVKAAGIDEAGIDRVTTGPAATRRAQINDKAQGNTALAAKLSELARWDDAVRAIEARQAELAEQIEQTTDADAQAALFQRDARLATAHGLAEDAYDAQVGVVLRSNVNEAQLEQMLELPFDPAAAAKADDPVQKNELIARQLRLEQLQAQFPDRAEGLRQLFDAYLAYEKVKGPLDDPNDLITLLRGSGVLEFRIAAVPEIRVPYFDAESERVDVVPSGGADPGDVTAYRERLRNPEFGPGAIRDAAGNPLPWRWFEVDDPLQMFDTSDERWLYDTNPAAAFATRGLVGERYANKAYVLLADTPGMAMTRDQDWNLTNASRGNDSQGRPAVDFEMDAIGGKLMGQLTGQNIGRQMAIVLDGRVVSAPTLQGEISGRGQITGSFSDDEIKYLTQSLDAGSLSTQLSDEPASVKTIGPTLGRDNLTSGLNAALLALIVVAIFIAAYYLFAGAVADFALVCNMVIILGIMAMLQAVWTLPGIAGIVLTIGMAVDANVLIFERIREEMERHGDLKAAIREGYGKALSTVFDANITTLITCFVLFYTATPEIKGFALVLGIGIVATLFTALFGTKAILDTYLALGARKLPMLPTLIPGLSRLLSPNVNWVGLRKYFFPISAVLLASGILAISLRGGNMLDIEFRSGTQVAFEFKDGQRLTETEAGARLDEVAAAAQAAAATPDPAENPDIRGLVTEHPGVDWSLLSTAAANLVTLGEVNAQGANSYQLTTLVGAENDDAVESLVVTAFGDLLNVTPEVPFAGRLPSGQDPTQNLTDAPVYPINRTTLAASLPAEFSANGKTYRPRTEFRGADIDYTAFRGGVAVYLRLPEGQALTEGEVRQRIDRVANLRQRSARQVAVVGGQFVDQNDQGRSRYASFAVLASEGDRAGATRYINLPDDYRTNASGEFLNPSGLAATHWQLVHEAMTTPPTLAGKNAFSSQVSTTMKQKALQAMILSLLAVVAYIWFRFGSIRYGLAAIAALVHDVVMVLGLIAICGWIYNTGVAEWLLLDPFKIDLAIVAALLTIIGYSLNDTIVVFDRIRENRGRLSVATPAIINDSINQTISRTLLTSATTTLALVTLYLFGGPGVHGFAFAMLIGVLVGTYSSVAIASPVLLVGTGKAKAAAKPVAPAKREPEPAV